MYGSINRFIVNYFSMSHQYINIIDNDYDYKIIERGVNAFAELGLSGEKFTIVDCSQNWMEQSAIYAIAESMQYSKTPGVVLSPDPATNTNLICFFPFFGVGGVLDWNNSNIQLKRTLDWSCLNRNPHPHRIWSWLQLKDKPNGITTMYNLYPVDLSELDSTTVTKWHEMLPTLPTSCHNDLDIDHPAYQHAMINLVTESLMRDTVFVSEKTWKPIASGQLFLIAGGRGTVAHLRSRGVDVFDDIIDHSYDLEVNWQKRLYAMYQSFESLLKRDLLSIWAQTQPRRQQNVDNFFASKFFNQDLTNLRERC
jgi:hypothetical protein